VKQFHFYPLFTQTYTVCTVLCTRYVIQDPVGGKNIWSRSCWVKWANLFLGFCHSFMVRWGNGTRGWVCSQIKTVSRSVAFNTNWMMGS